MNFEGKIGYVNNRDLPGLERYDRGHYVYIRKYNPVTKECEINTITSIKDSANRFKFDKLDKVEDGKVYAIPKSDINLPRFSGVYKGIKNVHISKIHGIGRISLNDKHKSFINDHMQ